MKNNKILSIGHRGASQYLPENTLEAFKMAFYEMSVDMIEFDVQLSKDSVPVVIHDPDLERTTNGVGKIKDYTLAELKKLDAGYFFDPHGNKSFPCRNTGIQIPTLEEVFLAFPTQQLAIEIKSTEKQLVHLIYDLIEKYNAYDRVVVGSLEHNVYRYLRKTAAKNLKIFCSKVQMTKLYFMFLFFPWIKSKTPWLVASMPAYHRIDFKKEKWIDWLHQKEIVALYWTVNDPAMMKTLINRGAHGIMSDDPNLILRLLNE